MTIGSWLARKLSDPEFEAWLDERIKTATRAAVAEALERIDEQALALTIADRVTDRVVLGVRAELSEVVAAIDGHLDEMADVIAEQINRVFGRVDELTRPLTELLGKLPRWPL